MASIYDLIMGQAQQQQSPVVTQNIPAYLLEAARQQAPAAPSQYEVATGQMPVSNAFGGMFEPPNSAVGQQVAPMQAPPARPAPIVDKSVQAPGTQQQAPIVDKSVQADPAMQQAAEQSTWAPRWEKIKAKLDDPKIMGPLQTFFAAISAPLQPGESTGSRLGQANMLMQTHKRMLEENERNAPIEAAKRAAEAAKQQADLRGTELRNEGTELGNTQTRLGMDSKLKKDAAAADAEVLKTANLTREQEDAHKNIMSQIAYRGRLPQAPSGGSRGGGSGDKAEIAAEYETSVWAPYKDWATRQAAVDPEADVSFAEYHKQYPSQGIVYRTWLKNAQKAGIQIGSRKESLGGGTPAAAAKPKVQYTGTGKPGDPIRRVTGSGLVDQIPK